MSEEKNPHPTEQDKEQDAKRAAKGTGDAEPDEKPGGAQVEGSTFSDQGEPV